MLAGLVALVAALLLAAQASQGASSSGGEPRAEAARACGTLQGRYERYRITTRRMTCTRGRRMIRRYLRGGRQRQPGGFFCHSGGMGSGALVCETRARGVIAKVIQPRPR